MKILFYIDVIGGGGAERVMANLANALAERGEEIIFVTSFPIENEYSLSGKITRYSLENFPPNRRNLVRKNITRIQKLRVICKKENCDVAVSFMEGPNFRLIFSTLFLPVKTVISLRSNPEAEYVSHMHRRLANFVYALSDACVFQTEEAKDFFGKRVRNKGVIIMNPVANAFYSDEEIKDRCNIISFGRLEKTKNFELLISAFSKIEADYPQEQLIIYGDGGYRKELEQLILQMGLSNRVRLPGRIDNVPEKIKAAKIFVLSSDYEGMPNTLMEAMAMGIPAIATNCPCGGPDALLEHGQYGILIPVNDMHALEFAMRKLLDGPEKCIEYSEKGRKRAERFRLGTICDEWMGLFKRLVLKQKNIGEAE